MCVRVAACGPMHRAHQHPLALARSIHSSANRADRAAAGDLTARWQRSLAAGACEMLSPHKAGVARRAAAATGLGGEEVELLVIIEGVRQARALHRHAAVASAKRLGRGLRKARARGSDLDNHLAERLTALQSGIGVADLRKSE